MLGVIDEEVTFLIAYTFVPLSGIRAQNSKPNGAALLVLRKKDDGIHCQQHCGVRHQSGGSIPWWGFVGVDGMSQHSAEGQSSSPTGGRDTKNVARPGV